MPPTPPASAHPTGVPRPALCLVWGCGGGGMGAGCSPKMHTVPFRSSRHWPERAANAPERDRLLKRSGGGEEAGPTGQAPQGTPGCTCCSHVPTCEGVQFRSGGPKRTQPLAGPPTDTPALATNLSQGPSGFPNVSLESQAFSPTPPTISNLHLATAGLGCCSAFSSEPKL